tara:strand:+ start:2322 stop:2894 length:573 start_codon:yes stop_codon:yes gene_type:complete
MIEFEEFTLCEDKILISKISDHKNWASALLSEYKRNRGEIFTSHKINGRWENSYLPVDLVPSVKKAMRHARDLATEVFKVSSMIVFKPLSGEKNSFPPFWFNAAKPNEMTGLHNHSGLSVLSGVAYLQADKNSGNLFFKNEEEFEFEPAVGKIIIFPPHLKHGVRLNESGNERISLAFNLFPFPLPNPDL